jgi:hypothetical protein
MHSSRDEGPACRCYTEHKDNALAFGCPVCVGQKGRKMSTLERVRAISLAVMVVMLVAAIPVWAEAPTPTDKYDLLLRPLPTPTDPYDLLPGPAPAPSSLPATGLSRALQADWARWQGVADQYLGSVPNVLPVAGLSRAQQADIARWQGWAEFYAKP